MRIPAGSWSSLLCLAACQASPSAEAWLASPRVWNAAVAEAAFTDSSAPAKAQAMLADEAKVGGGTPHVLAVDPVVAQLLRAAFAAHSVQRRVALENVTNVNTTGYKRRVVKVSTQLVKGSDGESFAVPVVLGIEALFTVGTLEITERNLDVAIDGDGFFAVMLPDGSTGYTRDGGFCINADGKIVTASGNVLLPEITIPSDALEISIDPEGRFSGRTAGSPDTSTKFGDITIHRFINPSGLRAEGANVLRSTEASGAPISGSPGSSGLGLLKQGLLERSNVQMVGELVNLQVLERQHQTLTAVMQQFGMIAP